MVFPSCQSFLVWSYLVSRSVHLFFSSPSAAADFPSSFRIILYLHINNNTKSLWVNKLSENVKRCSRSCLLNPYLLKKSLKVRLMGNPARRIFTVSSMPEYRSWFRTTSGSNLLGVYRDINKQTKNYSDEVDDADVWYKVL